MRVGFISLVNGFFDGLLVNNEPNPVDISRGGSDVGEFHKSEDLAGGWGEGVHVALRRIDDKTLVKSRAFEQRGQIG